MTQNVLLVGATEADLRSALVGAQSDQSNPFPAVMLAYALYMLTGQSALTELHNTHYADVHLENFAAFAATI